LPIVANAKSVDEVGFLADYPRDFNGEIGVDIVETISLQH
jgi:hypothetical protein